MAAKSAGGCAGKKWNWRQMRCLTQLRQAAPERGGLRWGTQQCPAMPWAILCSEDRKHHATVDG